MKRLKQTSVKSGLNLDPAQASALRELVRYVFDDELLHYYECDVSDRKGHVFEDIRVLALACGHVTENDLAVYADKFRDEEVEP